MQSLNMDQAVKLLGEAKDDPAAAILLAEIEEDAAVLLKPRTLDKIGTRPMFTPKQIEALEMMVGADQEAVFAGNQTGKTALFTQYVGMVATGIYPETVEMCIGTFPWEEPLEWFDPGRHLIRISLEPAENARWVKHVTIEREIMLRKFHQPTLCWISSNSGGKLRETLQAGLFGGSPIEDHIGEGVIPKELITSYKKAAVSVPDLLDYVQVKSAFGGTSTVATKMASQGAEGYTGAQVHVSVLDEKHPIEVLNEAIARTTNTGGIVLVGYTPRDGRTKLTEHFKNPEGKSERKKVVTMSVPDATFYSKQRVEEIKAQYSEYDKRARFYGLESMGQGVILPFLRHQIECPRPEMRPWWKYGKGCDFGHGGASGHPTAAVWCAWDTDTDVIYIYKAYKSMELLTSTHASVMKHPEDVWMFWPHDGLKTDRNGIATAVHYEKDGVKMFPMSARYLDPSEETPHTGGGQGDGEFIQEMIERCQTGRLKVCMDLDDWFKEQETWYYQDGKPYPSGDDLMKATKSAIIMRRHWQPREMGASGAQTVHYDVEASI